MASDKINNTFKLIGFRCVTPKDTDTLICVNYKGMKEVSFYDDKELFNEVLSEVTFNQRKLNQNEKWYYFYDGYSIENDVLKINPPQVESSILYGSNITTNVCCIVGRNGCGKSSIIEMILKTLNNVEFALKSHYYRIQNGQTFLKYAENLFCDLLLELNKAFFILSARGRSLTIKQWMRTKWMIIDQCTVKNSVSIKRGDCIYETNSTTNDFYGFPNLFTFVSFNNKSSDMLSYKRKASNSIKLITELSNNKCITQLSTIKDVDYDIPIKISSTFVQGHPLLSLCFYHNVRNIQFLYPLRYINDDCIIEGFELKDHHIKWETVSYAFKFNNATIKETKKIILKYLKNHYAINSDLSAEYEPVVNNVSTLAINLLAARYIEFAKKSRKSEIVRKWTSSEEFDNYEKKHYNQLIRESGNYDLLQHKDGYNEWIKYKSEHETWYNSLTDYLMQIVSDNFISNWSSSDFYDFVLDRLGILTRDVLIEKYVKIWQLASIGVDIFLQNKEANKTIYFDSIFTTKQENVVEFNGKIINLKELNMTVFDLVYPLQFLNIDLVLQQKNVNTTRYVSGLSAGEQQLLYIKSNFMYQLIKIDSGSKYNHINAIFDEIEMFMHPEWQRKFLSRIIEGLNKIYFYNLKCVNILIATHSPFILSDVPKSNVLFIEECGDTVDKQNLSETFGANIHDMFNNSFFMDSTLGEIAENHIKEIVSQYDKAKSDKDNKDNNLKLKIEQNKAKYDYILSIISDKYYKYTIKSMLDYMYRKYNIHSYEDITKSIEEHKIALKRLQNELNHLE